MFFCPGTRKGGDSRYLQGGGNEKVGEPRQTRGVGGAPEEGGKRRSKISAKLHWAEKGHTGGYSPKRKK